MGGGNVIFPTVQNCPHLTLSMQRRSRWSLPGTATDTDTVVDTALGTV